MRGLSFTQPLLVTIGLLYAGLGMVFLFDEQWWPAGFFIPTGVFFLGWSFYLLRKKRVKEKGAYYLPQIHYGSTREDADG